MKSFGKIFTLAVFIAMVQQVSGQIFQVPKNYVLDKKEDYAQYEKDVIACVNWLENTPMNLETKKREEANAFLMKWITGSPNVTIEIHPDIVNFMDKNPELLLIFMGGWTKYALENPDSAKNVIKGNLSGIRSVIKVYKKGIGIKKDSSLEKYIKLEDKGELEKWIEGKLKKK